ncbi:MAG: hypothetical protein OMM_11053 [Candidatus Magnetoglobus multicellularis str. Araruama]|uniref:Nucleotidyl transferase AbiEii toxin, Type IV TA system n=1 Tax=Candidatus Magnetoglobus multicellularis str. Araruama TaxID=890399 RepID=A0A1V1NZJ3_9BACT|nr:MAG: hypothetical protein OMM_11053 [Candidatus Magnetoglobus multicellularis str. Araruama]
MFHLLGIERVADIFFKQIASHRNNYFPQVKHFLPCILKDMYKTILTKNQLDLLPLIQKLSKDYYLVGGTAIALHIGHRRSIDFDLFTRKKINRTSLKN